MMTLTSTTPLSEFTRDVGDGFRPKEAELVNHYLKKKISGYDDLVSRIPELNIYKLEPWDLTQHSGLNSNEEEWYFFHRSSGKPSRTTPNGYWKDTCRKRKVIHAEEEIGTKKTFVFRIGRGSKGERTDWIIYEYSASFNDLPNQKPFVICKLFKKQKGKQKGKAITPTSAFNEHQNLYQKSNNPTFTEDQTSQLMICALPEEVDPLLLPYQGFFSSYNEQNYSQDPVIDSHMNTNTDQDLSYDDLWDFCNT